MAQAEDSIALKVSFLRLDPKPSRASFSLESKTCSVAIPPTVRSMSRRSHPSYCIKIHL
jgi:hypothetical protein